jgi:hypothetical protein
VKVASKLQPTTHFQELVRNQDLVLRLQVNNNCKRCSSESKKKKQKTKTKTHQKGNLCKEIKSARERAKKNVHHRYEASSPILL